MASKKTGFIGLGNIGMPMARHQIGNQFQLSVHDVVEAPVQELVAQGAVAQTPTEMARDCALVGLCVRDDRDVEDLLYGEQGMLAAATPGTIIAIHSTVTPQAVRKWAAEATEKGIFVIDAPITGGAHGAEAGELVYMVGGSEETLAQARPVFECSAKKVVHAGDVGAGISLKLCINMMTYSSFIAIKESTKLAQGAGLDPEVLYEVGRANGLVSDFNHRFIASRDAVFAGCDEATIRSIFEPFGRLGEKDLDAALATGNDLGIELPSAARNRELILDTFLKP